MEGSEPIDISRKEKTVTPNQLSDADKEMSVEEALQKADLYANDPLYKKVPSVSRTLASEVRRLQRLSPTHIERGVGEGYKLKSNDFAGLFWSIKQGDRIAVDADLSKDEAETLCGILNREIANRKQVTLPDAEWSTALRELENKELAATHQPAANKHGDTDERS